MPRTKYWKKGVAIGQSKRKQQLISREGFDNSSLDQLMEITEEKDSVSAQKSSDKDIDWKKPPNPKQIFKVSFDVEKFLDAKLKELDIVGQYTQELAPLSNQLRVAERKQKEISRLYTECEEQLQMLQESMDLPETEEDRKSPDSKPIEEVIIDDSDEDEEVVFLEATKPPVSRRKSASSGSHLTPPAVSAHTKPSTVLHHPQPQPAKNIYSQGSTIVDQPVPGSSAKMTQLRAALAAKLNEHITGATSNPVQVQDQETKLSPSSMKTQDFIKHVQTGRSITTTPQPSSVMKTPGVKGTHFGSIPLEIGLKVLAKKFNDIWYKGSLNDIQGTEKGKDEDALTQTVADLVGTDLWRYRVKFDGKGMKVVTGRHLAYLDTMESMIKVGSRVVAMYRDEDNPSANSFYAGIVAEPLSLRNNQRLLVFFDDGYAQYCAPKQIHKVCDQSIEVWRDIHPDSQDFIREYLKQYPERPMVRLQKGQIVKTEWNGKWWTARVIEVDASLAKMFFDADKRTEWIYRGSTRLEPLYTALCKAAMANEQTGKARRNNPSTMKGVKKPVVEYMRGIEEEKKAASQIAASKPSPNQPVQLVARSTSEPGSANNKKRSVAKKSTASKSQIGESSGQNWEAPWLKIQRPKSAEGTKKEKHGNQSEKDMASVLQKRLASCTVDNDVDEDLTGEGMDITNIPMREVVRVKYVPHLCSRKCNEIVDDDPQIHRGKNPLLIPMQCGWERQITKTRPLSKRIVMYKAPCGQRLRNIDEVDRFLLDTDCKLTIDLFCFDPILHTNTEIVPVKTFCDIKDLSYGKELVAISCVNGIDRQYPDYVEYSNQRMPCKGVIINTDPGFLVCCDCTDGCRDRTKCACCQQTVEASGVITGGRADPSAGYQDRRLKEPVITGIYECNSRCKCDQRCHNRVAQNGLTLRLQVFKTENRGWGLRCLDDVPCGGFLCIYAGQLLTEQGANEDGQTYGDEYLAELDYMEVVEKHKEGYESDVQDYDDNDDGEEDEDEEDNDNKSRSSDSDFDGGLLNNEQEDIQELRTLPTRNRGSKRKQLKERKAGQLNKLVLRRDSGSQDKEWSIKVQDRSSHEKPADCLVRNDDTGKKNTSLFSHLNKSELKDSGQQIDIDELPDLDDIPIRGFEGHKESRVKNLPDPSRTYVRAHRSMGTSRLDQSGFKLDESGDKEDPVGTRFYFQDGQQCYVMDAKSMGNIGRYLNHSCSPNVFVQSVFVDTHDLRFPWVAFFAGKYIRAGTELTWDYNYEVGSVPGKILHCYCGSAECRGRLL